MSNSKIVKESKSILNKLNKAVPLSEIYESYSRLLGAKDWNSAKALGLEFKDSIPNKLKSILANKKDKKVWEVAYLNHLKVNTDESLALYLQEINKLTDKDEITLVFNELKMKEMQAMAQNMNKPWEEFFLSLTPEQLTQVQERYADPLQHEPEFASTHIFKKDMAYVRDLINDFKNNPSKKTVDALIELKVNFHFNNVKDEFEVYQAFFEVGSRDLLEYFSTSEDGVNYVRSNYFFFAHSKESVLFMKNKEKEEETISTVEILEDIYLEDRLVFQKGQIVEICCLIQENKENKKFGVSRMKLTEGDKRSIIGGQYSPFWFKSEFEQSNLLSLRFDFFEIKIRADDASWRCTMFVPRDKIKPIFKSLDDAITEFRKQKLD
jgi:hypothetical protein